MRVVALQVMRTSADFGSGSSSHKALKPTGLLLDTGVSEFGRFTERGRARITALYSGTHTWSHLQSRHRQGAGTADAGLT